MTQKICRQGERLVLPLDCVCGTGAIVDVVAVQAQVASTIVAQFSELLSPNCQRRPAQPLGQVTFSASKRARRASKTTAYPD